MLKIDIHADDYGESLHCSQDILDCIKAGKLDSISVISNMNCFEECVKLYRKEESVFPKPPVLSVHLNFMEARCLADPARVPDLVDEDGHFCVSWMKLFLKSYLPGRKKLKEELKIEMKQQIMKVWKSFPEMKKLRIDSHQHTHMIPVVAAALFEVLEENGWETEYIRNSREPIFPFLKEISLYRTYRPVNFVKNIILNYCALLLEGRFKEKGFASMYLWGLVMSGHMDEARVDRLLPAMKRQAGEKGRTLEILFHPGQVLKEELTPEFSQEEAVSFYISPDRHVEKRAIMSFNDEQL